MKLLYNADDKVPKNSLEFFDELGMPKYMCSYYISYCILYRLQEPQRLRIAAIPMKHLFTTFQIVVEWINDGIYDFYTLPKSMKKLIKKQDEEKLNKIPERYKESKSDII